MEVWTWGRPLLEGFSGKYQKGYIETSPDAGIPFRRQKFSDIHDLVNCSFILDRDQYIEFLQWYKYNLKQGTIPFKIFDCRYGIIRIARLIEEPPEYAPVSKYYRMSLSMALEGGEFETDIALAVDEDMILIANSANELNVYGTIKA